MVDTQLRRIVAGLWINIVKWPVDDPPASQKVLIPKDFE
jgi:hypothetical protein